MSAESPTPAEFAKLQRVKPSEAVRSLQDRKLLSPSYSWRDVWQQEHVHQFTVSRLASVDLLAALRKLIERSVEGDLTRRDFLRDAKAALVDAQWWGDREVIDPRSGEVLRTRFDPARLSLIFDTNTRQAAAAGQWERVQATKRTHPYLRYITKRDERVRATHRAWDNVTLPVDSDFWQTHYPPNGWRCRCRVVAVSQAEYDKGATPGGAPMVKDAPKVVTRPWLNQDTGELVPVPAGIDPGFGYNAGEAARRAQLMRVARDKLVEWPADVGAAAWETMRAGLLDAQQGAWQVLVGHAERSVVDGASWPKGSPIPKASTSRQSALVHVVDQATLAALHDQGFELESAAVLMTADDLIHAVRTSKSARQAALTPAQWLQIPQMLRTAPAFLDSEDSALIYLLELQQTTGKVVIRVNYKAKTDAGKVRANFAVTGGVVEAGDLEKSGRYTPLKRG